MVLERLWIIMDLDNIWNSFLDKLKDQLLGIAYNFWFKNTKLVDLNDNMAIIIVQDESHKKHITENYLQIMTDTFNEVTGSIFKFHILTNEEYSNNNKKI